MQTRRLRIELVGGAVLLTAFVHLVVPAGPHGWHWLHLAAQKLYLVPIVLAAAWLGPLGALLTTFGASVLFAAHILTDWRGFEMVQADQVAEIANFWIVGAVAAGLFRREHQALEEVKVAHKETLTALAGSLELRERYTAGHSWRVRDYALLLADELGLRDPAFLASLRQGAFLHDVGKIGIPDGILLKQGPLEPAEQAVMRKHPEMGASLVGDIPSLREARKLILAHHERYDGRGYPGGLAAAEIPLAARVFTVGDAFDALTTDRPYHQALSWEETALLIADGRGSQFDPDVVDAFLRVPFDALAGVAAAYGVHLRRQAAETAGVGAREGGVEERP